MPKFKIQPSKESKLSRTVAKISQDEVVEKSGFIADYNNKTIWQMKKLISIFSFQKRIKSTSVRWKSGT